MKVPDVQGSTLPKPTTPFDLPCGQGPPLTIDGVSVPTTAAGTLDDLMNFKPMLFAGCVPSGGLKMTAGKHGLTASETQSALAITSISLHPMSQSRRPLPRRTARVEKWDNESRTVSVGPGPATYMVVAQNYNTSWVAKMGNRTLRPIRIDGWQQGYIIPSGAGGTVLLSLAPATVFHSLLVLGALLLIGLALLALLPSRRPDNDPSGPRPAPSFWVLLAGSLVLLTLMAGPLSLVVLPLLFVARRWGTGAMTVTAFLAFMGAGVAAALNPAAVDQTSAGAFGAPAQTASVIALAAVLIAATFDGRRSNRRSQMAADRDRTL